MAGQKADARLRSHGIDVTKGDSYKVALDDIRWAPPGHPLEHQRQHLFDPVNDPEDRGLVDSIKEHGYKPDHALLLHEDGTDSDGKRILWLGVGSRRFNAGLVARAEFIAEGKPELAASLRPFVFLNTGNYGDTLDRRLDENSDPLKKPDSLSVLAKMFAAMVRCERTHEQIAQRHGHGFTAATVDLVLRSSSLDPKAFARIEAGEAPVEIIGVLLDEPQDRHAEVLDLIIGAGARTARAARATVAQAKGTVRKKGKRPSLPSLKRAAEVLANLREQKLAKVPAAYADGVADALAVVLGTKPVYTLGLPAVWVDAVVAEMSRRRTR